jgi:hypothetical protein
MADTPFPLPRAARQTDVLDGDGTTTVFGPFSFKIFDIEDVEVQTRLAGATFFSVAAVTVAKTSGDAFSDFTVTFAAAPAETTEFLVIGRREPMRQLAVTKGGSIAGAELEKELSKQAVALSEYRRDLDRVYVADVGGQGKKIADIPAGQFVKADASGNLVAGGDADDIANAQGNAAIATAQALIATQKAAAATEWAINPEDTPVSLAAGGDAATTYSALHWAAKAAEFAALATLSDIRIYGAVATGDIANAAVNAAAIRAAIAATGTAIIPTTTLGFHLGTEQFDLYEGQFVVGVGGYAFLKSTLVGDLFSMRGKGAKKEQHGAVNLVIEGNGTSPGTKAIRIRNDQSIIYGLILDNIRCKRCSGGIQDYPEVEVVLGGTDISTTNASTQVNINIPAHGWTTAKVVTISGASAVGGLDVNGVWTVNVVNANTLRFNHTSAASSTATGGGAATVHFENGYVFDTRITNVTGSYWHGTAISLLWTQGQIWLDGIHLPLAEGAGSESDPAPLHAFPAVDLRDFVGLEIGRMNVVGQGLAPERTCTISNGTPAVVSRTSHKLIAQQGIVFTTTGALPSPLVAGTTYYVSLPAADTFNVSATPGGAAINTTDAGSGVHTYTTAIWRASAVGYNINGGQRTTDFLWANGMLRAEACQGTGIVLDELTFVRGAHVEAFGCRGHQILIQDCNRLQFSNLYGRGADDQVGAVTADCIHIIDSSEIDVSMWGAEVAVRDGMRLTNVTDSFFGSAKVALNGSGVNVTELGTSDRNTFRDVREAAGSTHTLIGARSRWLGGVNGTDRRPQSGWACKAHRNGTDTAAILSATWTQVSFATEEYDFENTYGTGTFRITPKAGPARIRAQVRVDSGIVDGSPLTIALRMNGGATAVAEYQVTPGSTSPIALPVEWSGIASGTDYFEVWVYLAGAGNKVVSGQQRYTFFEGAAL